MPLLTGKLVPRVTPVAAHGYCLSPQRWRHVPFSRPLVHKAFPWSQISGLCVFSSAHPSGPEPAQLGEPLGVRREAGSALKWALGLALLLWHEAWGADCRFLAQPSNRASKAHFCHAFSPSLLNLGTLWEGKRVGNRFQKNKCRTEQTAQGSGKAEKALGFCTTAVPGGGKESPGKVRVRPTKATTGTEHTGLEHVASTDTWVQQLTSVGCGLG